MSRHEMKKSWARIVLTKFVLITLTLGFLLPVSESALALDPCPNTNAFTGISNLTLWLRADCVNGVDNDPADNSTVTTWSDLSGNGNNATGYGTPTFQSDSANLINSQPVINFNGSATFTSIDIRAITRPNVTIFSVYKLRSSNTVGVWGIDDGGWDRFFMARWTGDNGIISHSGTTAVPNSGENGVTKYVTTIYKYNVSSGSSVYSNGALVSSFTDNAAESAAQTTLRIGSIGAIGSGYALIGDVAEIIIFSQALSAADLITVNGYLNTKYNLGISSGNLPVSDTTAPTFTSSSSFSAAENISTSATAATITVSESATVTISGGADSSAFDIYSLDSRTALIKFKSSPNYEAPSDSGGDNVYNLTLSATDAAGNAGTQAITVTVTDVVDTSTFNSLSISGNAVFRQAVTLSANISVASRVTFRAKNIVIPGCKNKLTSGSSPNIIATCTWRPSIRGNVVVIATAVPTGAGISNATATPLSLLVGNRSGLR